MRQIEHHWRRSVVLRRSDQSPETQLKRPTSQVDVNHFSGENRMVTMFGHVHASLRKKSCIDRFRTRYQKDSFLERETQVWPETQGIRCVKYSSTFPRTPDGFKLLSRSANHSASSVFPCASPSSTIPSADSSMTSPRFFFFIVTSEIWSVKSPMPVPCHSCSSFLQIDSLVGETDVTTSGSDNFSSRLESSSRFVSNFDWPMNWVIEFLVLSNRSQIDRVTAVNLHFLFLLIESIFDHFIFHIGVFLPLFFLQSTLGITNERPPEPLKIAWTKKNRSRTKDRHTLWDTEASWTVFIRGFRSIRDIFHSSSSGEKSVNHSSIQFRFRAQELLAETEKINQNMPPGSICQQLRSFSHLLFSEDLFSPVRVSGTTSLLITID